MKRVRPESEQVASFDPASARKVHQSDDLGVTFYKYPPNAEVSVRQFEDYTASRLKLLHAIDRACNSQELRLEQMKDSIRPKLGNEFRESGLELVYPETKARMETFRLEKVEFQSRDSISHFALRLAFCKSRDAREWFLRQEQRLFVLRFEALNAEAREAFLGSEGIECNRFVETEGEKMTLKMLQRCTPGAKIWVEKSGTKVPEFDQTFYVMPFRAVPEKLISGRRVVLQRGKAYVPASLLKLVITKRFKENLAEALEVAFHGQHAALMDPRVGGFLRVLQDYGLQLVAGPRSSSEEPREKLSLQNFEELLPRSFPPCMRRLVEKQRETTKHLKHAGRLQLRPFLKACGFTFEESCQWWKKELCRDPLITSETYEKSYHYDNEHAYGKKGHHQGQNCFGCPKIIGSPGEAPGQVHGCVFKQLEPSALQNQLQRWQVPLPAMMEIQRLIKEGKHYQLACIEYFKSQHPLSDGEGVGNSPVDFFRSSVRFHKEKEKEKGTTSPTKEVAAVASEMPQAIAAA
ncbi:unnamed protein product [Durusdinium trenchii]|uniref:DNA primase large subunit (DNA primase 58 kDa subunit) (p58) n=2 Tax=Durusdinium trenchii TaxID=1381693 RepID=A0ABP0IPM2_9DINO